MFAGRAGAYPSESLTRDKNSSSQRTFINYGQKSFITFSSGLRNHTSDYLFFFEYMLAHVLLFGVDGAPYFVQVSTF